MTFLSHVPPDIARLLDDEARRINSPAFIDDDPVQFARMFSALPDIEIAALFVAHIAWGNRKMICRDARRMLSMMHDEPHRFVMSREYERLDPGTNVHRTFFVRHMQHMMRGLHLIYSKYSSLDEFTRANRVSEHEAPAWHLAHLLNHSFAEANGQSSAYCLPLNLKTTALKRLNMALRWLVRNDGIVDMGVWRSIKPSQLYIPLDVHVGNISRRLGLLQRKSDNRKAVEELTATLRTLRPQDPCLYDYALFGIGIGI